MKASDKSWPHRAVPWLWFLAGLVALAAVATELLPVVFGTGGNAGWDWSFAYVTLHFVALPIISAGQIIAALVVTAGAIGRRQTSAAISAASSIALPVCYLLVLVFHPLFWFVR